MAKPEQKREDRSGRALVIATAGVIVMGWTFVLFHNNFHVGPGVVFAMLGYLAAVLAIVSLFRTGAAAVAANPEAEDGEWGEANEGVGGGAQAQLEREKRTLLKAIKEVEFDLQMGKLSKGDADHMVRTYRLRAIDVIKLLEVGADGDGPLTVRQQIEREVRARLEIEGVRVKVTAAELAARKPRSERAAAAAQQAARSAAERGASAAAAAADAQAAAAKVTVEEEAAALVDAEMARVDAEVKPAKRGKKKSKSKVTAQHDQELASDDDATTTTTEPEATATKEAAP
jgi:hypothetical protein